MSEQLGPAARIVFDIPHGRLTLTSAEAEALEWLLDVLDEEWGHHDMPQAGYRREVLRKAVRRRYPSGQIRDTTYVFTYPNHGTPDGYPELRAHSGQTCVIVRELGDHERDPEVGRMFIVRFADGTEVPACQDELAVQNAGAES